MWCAPDHRNVQDVRMQCHADELMCMKWCAMSHTFEYIYKASTSKPLHAPCSAMTSTDDTRERCNQKPPALCHAYGIMHMMWCIGSQSCFSQLTSCFMILSGYKLWFQIRLHHVECIWDHEHQRMRNRTQDCTTGKQILLCYSFFYNLACCILLSVAW